MDKRTTGLYNKFQIRRTDGKSEPGQKHADCEYFVLDVTHDKHSHAALLAYADSCEAEFPLLARDIRIQAQLQTIGPSTFFGKTTPAIVAESAEALSSRLPVEEQKNEMPLRVPKTEPDTIADLRDHQTPYSWQPIETAPKDGTLIVLSVIDEDGPVVAFWDGSWTKRHAGEEYFVARTATGWMPLPPAPQGLTGGNQAATEVSVTPSASAAQESNAANSYTDCTLGTKLEAERRTLLGRDGI